MRRKSPLASHSIVGGSCTPRKAQYERQFTLWRFRKKLSSNEWEFVFGRMEKRKREGKENELFVEGFRVPDKRIKKEISRHHWTNETGMIS